jgi:hypothetical protein
MTFLLNLNMPFFDPLYDTFHDSSTILVMTHWMTRTVVLM